MLRLEGLITAKRIVVIQKQKLVDYLDQRSMTVSICDLTRKAFTVPLGQGTHSTLACRESCRHTQPTVELRVLVLEAYYRLSALSRRR